MKAIRRAALALLAAGMLLASGCGSTDPDRMAIITGAAIDLADGMYELTIESIKVEGSSLDEPIETQTFTAAGRSLDLAEAELERLTGSRLYWGHAQALVLSEAAASDALPHILDWVMRSGDLRLTLVLAVSRADGAKEIFSSAPSGSYSMASAIAGAARDGGFSERLAGASTHRALEALLDNGAALLPAVRPAEQEDRSYAVLDGGAVLAGSRLAGFLDEDEARDMLLLLGAGEARELVRFDGGTAGMKIEDINSAAAASVTEDGTPLLRVSVSGGCVTEYLEGSAEQLDEERARELTDVASAALAQRIERAIEASRALGADIAGFAEQFEKGYEDAAADAALTAEVEVSVELEITDTGLISRFPEPGADGMGRRNG